jgi:hypothetical protein
MNYEELIRYGMSLSGDSCYKLQAYHLDARRPGNDLVSQILSAGATPEGQAIVGVLATIAGLNPAETAAAVEAGHAVTSHESAGRKIFSLVAPVGYLPCRIGWRRVSEMGRGGIGARVYPGKVDVDIWLASPGASCELEIAVLSIYWRKARNSDWRDSDRVDDFHDGVRCWDSELCFYPLDMNRPDDPIGPTPIAETW